MVVTDEMVEVVGKALWRYWGVVSKDADKAYRSKTRAALVEALKIMPLEECCSTCKGSGEIMGTIPHPNGDPQCDEDGVVICAKCGGTGEPS